MKLEIELEQIKKKVLIIDKHPSPFLFHLRDELKKYDNEVFISPKIPPNLGRFDIYFIINEPHALGHFAGQNLKKIIFIFINQKKAALNQNSTIITNRLNNIKTISLENFQEVSPDDTEKILWFSFSRSPEIFLKIHSLKAKKKQEFNKPAERDLFFYYYSLLKKVFQPKKIVITTLSFIIFFHIVFVIPLTFATYFHYLAVKSLMTSDIKKVSDFTEIAKKLLKTSKGFYVYSRPSFLLLGIVIVPDNLIELNEKANFALLKSVSLYQESSTFTTLLLKKDKTPQDKILFSLNLEKMQKDIDELEANLSATYQNMPSWGNQLKKTKEVLKETLTLMAAFQKILPSAENILAKDTEKKYLLLFANNMEIRPGGGFIGSFGILTLKDLSLHDLKIYDVYDADGQLKAHVVPPKPIEQYLQQPHWFLRDSAFSPDFSENYKQALFFLEKEMGFSDFAGGIMITTTAVQNILSSMGNLYIPDFKEIINKENFYLKAQLYSEKEFFPGSLQKKRFLSSVLDQILINVENASLPNLFRMTKKSLDEKQIVMYFEDQALQETADSLYWSGRMINPVCAAKTKNCIVDYLFQVDANLGVNKANFFIHRSFGLEVKIDEKGIFTNHLTVRLKNDSIYDVFPGGVYKNYMQFILPKNSIIKTITKNGSLIENYDEKDTVYKIVGFFLELKPQSTAEISIIYQLNEILSTGQGVYQFIIQKQIGSPNSDIDLQISFPKNVYIINQNFSPLVKENNILYNTTLTADKIFYIDLTRE